VSLVLVEWGDAFSTFDWQDGEPEPQKALPCHSVGNILQDDAHGMHLAQTVGAGRYSGSVFIPRDMIRSVKRLNIDEEEPRATAANLERRWS
jgi:hypothetical protein